MKGSEGGEQKDPGFLSVIPSQDYFIKNKNSSSSERKAFAFVKGPLAAPKVIFQEDH